MLCRNAAAGHVRSQHCRFSSSALNLSAKTMARGSRRRPASPAVSKPHDTACGVPGHGGVPQAPATVGCSCSRQPIGQKPAAIQTPRMAQSAAAGLAVLAANLLAGGQHYKMTFMSKHGGHPAVRQRRAHELRCCHSHSAAARIAIRCMLPTLQQAQLGQRPLLSQARARRPPLSRQGRCASGGRCGWAPPPASSRLPSAHTSSASAL